MTLTDTLKFTHATLVGELAIYAGRQNILPILIPLPLTIIICSFCNHQLRHAKYIILFYKGTVKLQWFSLALALALALSPSLRLSVCLSVCLYVSLSLSVRLCLCLRLRLCLSLSLTTEERPMTSSKHVVSQRTTRR